MCCLYVSLLSNLSYGFSYLTGLYARAPSRPISRVEKRLLMLLPFCSRLSQRWSSYSQRYVFTRIKLNCFSAVLQHSHFKYRPHRFACTCPNVKVGMSAICLRCSPQCEFLSDEAQSPAVFSPSSLRVAACDLQQLMATFSHVYETDLRAYCSRDPPSFSTETDVFQRIHQLLLACITVLMALDMHVQKHSVERSHTDTFSSRVFLRSWKC